MALIALPLAVGPVAARAPDDQAQAYASARSGEILELGAILRVVTPRVGGAFIGSSYDSESQVYQLRFMRGTTVVNVEVDARNGRLLSPRQKF